MTQLNKIHQLQKKKAELESKIDSLMLQRSQQLSEIISQINLNDIPDEIIIGSLLHLKNEFDPNKKESEAWLEAGKKFLKKHPPRPQRKTPSAKAAS